VCAREKGINYSSAGRGRITITEEEKHCRGSPGEDINKTQISSKKKKPYFSSQQPPGLESAEAEKSKETASSLS